ARRQTGSPGGRADGDVVREAGPKRGSVGIPSMEMGCTGCYYTPPLHANKLPLLQGRDTFGRADNSVMADRHPCKKNRFNPAVPRRAGAALVTRGRPALRPEYPGLRAWQAPWP